MKTLRRALAAAGLALLVWAGSHAAAQPAPESDSADREPSRDAVLRRIEQAGRTKPDWWDDTPLRHPATLDLNWPKPSGRWNADVNPGQYMVSVVNRRPDLWRSAAKLCHQVATTPATPDVGRQQAMDWLARLQGRFLGDYASAAYWWQRLRDRADGLGSGQTVCLAECYWRLGSRTLALETLKGVDRGTVKLRGEMGPLSAALEAAEAEARRTSHAEDIWIAAADACRGRGDLEQAAECYRKVTKGAGNARFRTWAEEGLKALRTWAGLRAGRLADGTHTGSGTGYRGPVTVKVVVREGRLQEIVVTSHKEDWFGRALTDMPEQLVRKQGLSWADAVSGATRSGPRDPKRPRPLVAGVDAVSGATRTSDAILNAVAAALADGGDRGGASRH